MDADPFVVTVEETFAFCLHHVTQQREQLTPLALQWLDHATTHLFDRVDLYLRQGQRPTPRTEDQMRALIKGLGVDFRAAAADLKQAAEALKAAGKGLPANRAYSAYLRVSQQADLLE